MWGALQQGNVVVHCLAGMHRAPAICCCFWLYRYYKLGHKLINNIGEMYKIISGIRQGAEPLGYIEMIKTYEIYLKTLKKI